MDNLTFGNTESDQKSGVGSLSIDDLLKVSNEAEKNTARQVQQNSANDKSSTQGFGYDNDLSYKENLFNALKERDSKKEDNSTTGMIASLGNIATNSLLTYNKYKLDKELAGLEIEKKKTENAAAQLQLGALKEAKYKAIAAGKDIEQGKKYKSQAAMLYDNDQSLISAMSDNNSSAAVVQSVFANKFSKILGRQVGVALQVKTDRGSVVFNNSNIPMYEATITDNQGNILGTQEYDLKEVIDEVRLELGKTNAGNFKNKSATANKETGNESGQSEVLDSSNSTSIYQPTESESAKYATPTTNDNVFFKSVFGILAEDLKPSDIGKLFAEASANQSKELEKQNTNRWGSLFAGTPENNAVTSLNTKPRNMNDLATLSTDHSKEIQASGKINNQSTVNIKDSPNKKRHIYHKVDKRPPSHGAFIADDNGGVPGSGELVFKDHTGKIRETTEYRKLDKQQIDETYIDIKDESVSLLGMLSSSKLTNRRPVLSKNDAIAEALAEKTATYMKAKPTNEQKRQAAILGAKKWEATKDRIMTNRDDIVLVLNQKGDAFNVYKIGTYNENFSGHSAEIIGRSHGFQESSQKKKIEKGVDQMTNGRSEG